MFEDIRHATESHKLQRKRRKMLRSHREAYKQERKKFGRDGAEALDAEQDIERQIIDEEISLLLTRHLIEKAEYYQVPIPEFSSENGAWLFAKQISAMHLSVEEIAKLRSAIRKEEKERWEKWQARLTLAIGFGGMLIGLASVLKK